MPAALLNSTFISRLGSVVRLEAQLEELVLYFYFFLNSIAVSEVLLDRWSPLALVPISTFLEGEGGRRSDRGFHGSCSSSSTLGARGLYLSKGGEDSSGFHSLCLEPPEPDKRGIAYHSLVDLQGIEN